MFDAIGTTAMLAHELGHVDPGRPSVRYAEVATMLRLAGEVVVDEGWTTIRAGFGSPAAAARLRDGMAALFGCEGTVETVADRIGPLRCTVHVTAPGTDLARATGADRPTGAPSLLTGTATAVAIWRGALLARGRVSRPRGRLQLQVACPGQAAALTLVDAAHWLGLSVRDRETAAEHRVLVRDPDGVDTLLRAVGATRTADALRGHAIPAPRPCADPV